MPRISQLTSLTTPDAADELPIVDTSASVTKKISVGDLLKSAISFITPGTVTTAALADGAVTPVKRSGGFATGVIAGSVLNSTGNKSITGLGFTPKMVEFYTLPPASTTISSYGEGVMTPTAQSATWIAGTTAGTRNSYTNRCIAWGSQGSTTATLSCSYVSMDADGFTINVNTAANNFDIAYKAYA